GRAQDWITRKLLPRNEVFILGNGHPLLWLRVTDAGVNEARPPVSGDRGAAGVDGSLAFFRRRPDRDGQVLPTDEVLAAGVSPVLIGDIGAKRIVLIEEMVPALIKEGSVRIA